MIKPLSNNELRAIETVLQGKALKEQLKHFHSAMSKLRMATGTEAARELPELKHNSPLHIYTLKWFKSRAWGGLDKEARDIVNRYQHAVYEANQTFWRIRSDPNAAGKMDILKVMDEIIGDKK